MGGRKWTKEEEEYLEEKWGQYPIPSIAKRLNRTEDAIVIRARKKGLGAVLDSGDYITLNQLVKAVTGGTNGATSGKLNSWVKNRGLPVRRKRVRGSKFLVVDLEEFWEWAYKNRSFLNFSKMEPMILGEEPTWVAEQRRMDSVTLDPQREDPWTPEEDSRLEMLVGQYRYTAEELSRMIKRSEGAIRKRCEKLNLKGRPVSYSHKKWTEYELNAMVDYIKRAVPYEIISIEMGRSVKSIKTKVSYIYLTFDQDKVREMIGDGKWGDGAPVPKVRTAIHLSRTMTGVKKDLSALAGLLQYRAQVV